MIKPRFVGTCNNCGESVDAFESVVCPCCGVELNNLEENKYDI